MWRREEEWAHDIDGASAPYNCGQEARRLTPSARVARSKVDGCGQIQLVDQNIKYSILDTTCSCGSGNKRRMTVKEKLVATLPPLGFIVDGHTEEFDFCCEDVNGYDCLLTLELHPNFLSRLLPKKFTDGFSTAQRDSMNLVLIMKLPSTTPERQLALLYRDKAPIRPGKVSRCGRSSAP